jgi:hypothetical protein
MASGDQYRLKAAECTEAAQRASEPERKVGLLELAQKWLQLAEQADNRDRNGVRGNALLDPPWGPDRHIK